VTYELANGWHGLCVKECENSGKEVNPTLRSKAGKNFLAKSISSRKRSGV